MIGIVMIVIGVFVSNERDREMRGSSAQGAELDSSVCNSSFRESRTNSPGHFKGGARARSVSGPGESGVKQQIDESSSLTGSDFLLDAIG